MFARLLKMSDLKQTSPRSYTTSTHQNIPTVPRHKILTYKYVEDVAEKRPPHRAAHLAHAKAFSDKGSLILGGATQNPLDQGILIFEGVSREEVEDFAKNDPYVRNGIVSDYTIR
eukprot:TRINITY_DN2127_c0_g1_i2.p1 TRINITY_DN2127_c0_g1~~TRINITY_DN2127_c0_g1_i2.p1  ORF type:complete len:115 (-),score=21.09 TRINITY_DN2127_c0_g1_i2:153-497(-)